MSQYLRSHQSLLFDFRVVTMGNLQNFYADSAIIVLLKKLVFLLPMKQMDLKRKYGEWALVAGAAEGLGKAFSVRMAAEGMSLILVDQQKQLLDTLSADLKRTFKTQVSALHLDLADKDSIGYMMEAVRAADCRLIIYNAAFSRVQKFIQNDPDMLDRYVQVNIQTPLKLIHAFCQMHMEDKTRRKGLLLMSSLAGSWGTQLLGPYGGSKAFNQNLAESLHHELKSEGFDVLACIAGPTSTPGYLSSLPGEKAGAISVMLPEDVVSAGLDALGRKAFVVPGFRNKLNYFLMTRILPRRVSLRIINRAVGKLYHEILTEEAQDST